MEMFKSLLRMETKAKDNKDGEIFYHYTSRRAADSISLEGRIRNKGNGILLNTMAPERYFRSEILQNNYGDHSSSSLQNKADYCVRVLSTKLIDKKLTKNQFVCGRLTYLYDGDIKVNEHDVFDKPTCKRSPQTIHSDVQQSTCSSVSRSDQKSIHFDCDMESEKKLFEIQINLRSGVNIYQRHRQYQDENVNIYAFEWMKQGLKIIRNSIDGDILVNVENTVKYTISRGDFSLKDLQTVSRNERFNTNGEIDFRKYVGISKEVVLAMKDLTRQSVIVGKDRTTHYGGYLNERVQQSDLVFVCDLIGLQFQQSYNSGRLVIVGEHLPTGLLDEFIYQKVVNEKKPTIEQARNDHSGRFVGHSGVFFDTKAYVKFVANDVVLAGIALNHNATGPINFKFLKYGTGYFAGPFRQLLERFIGQGVADGLECLFRRLPKSHSIKRIELPFFDQNPSIDLVCSKYNVELAYSMDDALKKTHSEYTTATTNSADPHTITGNKIGFGSVDGAIAENLSGKAIKFSQIINKLMKENFV